LVVCALLRARGQRIDGRACARSGRSPQPVASKSKLPPIVNPPEYPFQPQPSPRFRNDALPDFRVFFEFRIEIPRKHGHELGCY